MIIKDKLFKLNVIDDIAEKRNILYDYINTFTTYKKSYMQY